MSKRKIVDKCRLCERVQELRFSHIIPELLYKPTYNDKHQAIEVTSQLGKKDKIHQKGLREHLLCASCEIRLSKHETYASPILRSIQNLGAERHREQYIVRDVQYAKFKLFQLSLLWRTSISSNEMFHSVEIGEHEEILRRMLLSEVPGKPDEYGCAMFVLENIKHLHKVIFAPVTDQIDGLTTYRFLTSNLFWFFFLPGAYPKEHKDLFISLDGILHVVRAPWSEEEIIRRFFGPIAIKTVSSK